MVAPQKFDVSLGSPNYPLCSTHYKTTQEENELQHNKNRKSSGGHATEKNNCMCVCLLVCLVDGAFRHRNNMHRKIKADSD